MINTNVQFPSGQVLISGMKRRPLLLTLLILVLTTPASSQYVSNSWTADNGLPQNTVYSILQTRDGYLWFTTLDGLVRFDGVKFAIFDKSKTQGLNSNRFNSLFEDRDGDLWIGTEDGGLTRYHDGKFITYTTEDGLPHNQIRALFGDYNGGLFVLSRAGLAVWQGEKFTSHSLTTQILAGMSCYQDRSGALWFDSPSGLNRYKDATLTTFTRSHGLQSYLATTFFEDQQDNLWVGTRDAGFSVFKDGRFTSYGVKDGLPHEHVTAIGEDRLGNLWIGTRAGLACFKGNRFAAGAETQEFSGRHITEIYEDREGILWVGTINNGLSCVRRRAVNMYTKSDGLSDNNIYPVFQDSLENIWIGAYEGGLTRYREGIFAPGVAPTERRSDRATTALAEDRHGRLWLGKVGSIWFLKDGKLTSFDPGFSIGYSIVRAIHQDREGTIWFATSEALLRYKDTKVTRYTTADGLAGNDVQVLLEDLHGRLWIGTYGGLTVYSEGRFTSFSEREGLASNRVRSLYEDRDQVLWIGTYDGGLSRFKDRQFTRYTVNQGLFNNGVFCILEDGRGNLWMSSNRGIYSASRQQLNDFAEGKIQQITCRSYGKQDGLLNIECNGGRQPAGYKMRDGKLWFPTQNGLAVVDPEAISINPQPPPVVIENCVLQGETVDFLNDVEIRPGKENLEIHYTGLSFVKPEQVRFKYKLEGLDSDWVDAGTRRVAYYSHLPPGHYTFRVLAGNSDGVWNMTGASLSTVVIPPFWQTRWFLALVALSIVGAALLAYERRVSRLERAHRAQEAFSRQLIDSQESERKRIAAELHDSLGQNLLIIKNWTLLGLSLLEPSHRGKAALDEISTAASQALNEVRQITYDLRPYHLDEIGLSKALEAMIKRVVSPTGLRMRVDIESLDGALAKEKEINLYRIVQECVNNIIKHSQSTEASVDIRKDSRQVQITIEDNGRGFSPEETTSGNGTQGGFGLRGISERTRMLGGTYLINSAPGQGTTINIAFDLEERQKGSLL